MQICSLCTMRGALHLAVCSEWHVPLDRCDLLQLLRFDLTLQERVSNFFWGGLLCNMADAEWAMLLN